MRRAPNGPSQSLARFAEACERARGIVSPAALCAKPGMTRPHSMIRVAITLAFPTPTNNGPYGRR